MLGGGTPLDIDYGKEIQGREGILSEVQQDGRVLNELVVAPQGDYMQLFNAVFETIRLGKPYFVSEEQILWQLEILEPSR